MMIAQNKTTSYIEIIVLILLFMTPVFSFGEIIQLFWKSGAYSQSKILTPFYIKALKDLLVIILFLLIARNILISQKLNTYMAMCAPLVFIIVTPIFAWSLLQHPLIAISGIRWLMYFILGILLIGYVRNDFMNNVAKMLYYLFLLHFVMQILQMFFSLNIHGVNFLGYSLRNPGIFLIPNTGGFFTILAAFFAFFYLKDKTKQRVILFLVPLSVFLTASATTLAVFLVSGIFVFTTKKYRKLLPILFPIIILIVVSSFEILGRGNDLMGASFGTRVEIFNNLLGSTGFFSKEFGTATQTAVLLSLNMGMSGNTYFTDSTYGAILANIGFVGFIIFSLCQLLWMYWAYMLNNNAILIFTLIYTSYGLTTSITEAFPMNILFSILLAYYIPIVLNYIRQRPLSGL